MALLTPAASALMTAVGDTPAVDRPAGQLIAAAIVGIAIVLYFALHH
jgi:GntP family gluconate:H+ symporter